MSSYQKLKSDNKQLKKDIYNLIRQADKLPGLSTKKRYEMEYDLYDSVMFGSVR